MSGKWKKGQPEGPCQSSLEQENTNFASITLSVWYTLYYCIKCIYTLYTRTIQYTLYSTQSEKFRQDLLSKSQEYQFCQYNTLCLVIYSALYYCILVQCIYTLYTRIIHFMVHCQKSSYRIYCLKVMNTNFASTV